MARSPSIAVFSTMHYSDAAKYVTETGQPAIFAIIEMSKKWYEFVAADLQQIVDKDAASESAAINPWTVDFNRKARKPWTDSGGELISLPADEQSAMLKSLRVSATTSRRRNPRSTLPIK